MSYGYGDNCSAALSRAVDSNRWVAENRAEELERRVIELENR